MGNRERIERLEERYAHSPVEIANFSTPHFGFFQTADDGNGYPQPQDKPNVYFAYRSVPGPFNKTNGQQTLTVDPSDFGWYFLVPSQTYIAEGQNVVLMRDGWQWIADENAPALYQGTVSGTSMSVTSLNGQSISFSTTVVNNIGATGSAVALGFVNQGPPWVISGGAT